MVNLPAMEVRDLGFAYGDHVVLRDISFGLEEGKLLGMLGPNGAGKTTLFRCILGLEKKHSGKIRLAGEEIKSKSPAALARMIAYVPQTHYPSFNYSALEMTLMGTASQGREWSVPGNREKQAAREALEQMGAGDLCNRGFRSLSGGEQQLVLIARALVQDAKILVMDEPTANLDYGNQIRVLQHIKNLSGRGYSIILSTHNPDHAFLFADRVLALHDTRIAASGSPEDVLTEELIGRLYKIPVRIRRDEQGMMSCVPSPSGTTVP
jgi:iron complex transport system ATP-binding protein